MMISYGYLPSETKDSELKNVFRYNITSDKKQPQPQCTNCKLNPGHPAYNSPYIDRATPNYPYSDNCTSIHIFTYIQGTDLYLTFKMFS
jgi:hypothetical protein